ncbi:MAG TPA: MFS transporter [Coxiellaceae bacterium]|nr:MFS transporter [Coxiellaceae bacterium]
MGWLHERRRLFQNKAFFWYALSCFFVLFANGLNFLAMSWLMISETNQIHGMVNIMIGFWLPNLIISPFAGVIVDRYSRRACLFTSECLRSVCMLVLGAISYWAFSPTLIYLIAYIQGALFAFIFPAIIAIIREIVEENDLLLANATIDIIYEVGNIVGIAVCGLLIIFLRAQGALLAGGVCFLIGALCLLKMPYQKKLEVPPRSLNPKVIGQELGQGLVYMLKKKNILVIYTVQILVMVTYMITPAVVLPFAKLVLHADSKQFSALTMMLSAGVIAGGLSIPSLAERWGLIACLKALLIIMIIGFLIFSVDRSLWHLNIIQVVIGFCLAVWPLMMTEAQKHTDFAYQGRVQGSFNTLSGIMIVIVYTLIDVSSRFMAISHLFYLEVAMLALALVLIYKHQDAFQ